MNPIPLIVIVGPTASGKTTLAVEVSKQRNGEVVSADSMQIYKYMDIATAKPTPEETDGIRHHLIDFLEPTESFSVVDYCEAAGACIRDIRAKGKLPVVVGGTGLYVRSLIENLSFPEAKADYALREKLKTLAETAGADFLLDELMKVDAQTARTLHPNNLCRIVRALEIYYTTGIPMSEHIAASHMQASPYESCIIGLDYRDRKVLYERINRRVDEMVNNGLLEEARAFIGRYNEGTAAQAIGYKELIPYFNGEIALEQAIEKLKQETRRYSKRQRTWFRKEDGVHWVYADDYDCSGDLVTCVVRIIDESGITAG